MQLIAHLESGETIGLRCKIQPPFRPNLHEKIILNDQKYTIKDVVFNADSNCLNYYLKKTQ